MSEDLTLIQCFFRDLYLDLISCHRFLPSVRLENSDPFYVQCRLTRFFRAVSIACHIIRTNILDFGGPTNSRMSVAEFNMAVCAIMIPFVWANFLSMFLSTLYFRS